MHLQEIDIQLRQISFISCLTGTSGNALNLNPILNPLMLARICVLISYSDVNKVLKKGYQTQSS